MTILALYGKSCSGKTAIARCFESSAYRPEIRYCGEIFRAEATRNGVSPDKLPLDVHRTLDEATLRVAHGAVPGRLLILEGNFLHYVLRTMKSVTLVEIMASDDVRQKRHFVRSGREDLECRERADEHLIQRLYAGTEPLDPVLRINTSNNTAHESAAILSTLIQSLHDKA